MRVLVTGGAGFIGSHIVDALVAVGHDVAVLDDLDTGFRENVNAGARLVIGSVADEDLVRDTMQGCDLVFHQAAHKAVLRSVERPLITDTVNTHGTLTVLKAALDAGVGRVVHASSSSVYGGRRRSRPPKTSPRILARRMPFRSSRPSTTAGSSTSCTGSRRWRSGISTSTAPANAPTRPMRR